MAGAHDFGVELPELEGEARQALVRVKITMSRYAPSVKDLDDDDDDDTPYDPDEGMQEHVGSALWFQGVEVDDCELCFWLYAHTDMEAAGEIPDKVVAVLHGLGGEVLESHHGPA